MPTRIPLARRASSTAADRSWWIGVVVLGALAIVALMGTPAAALDAATGIAGL